MKAFEGLHESNVFLDKPGEDSGLPCRTLTDVLIYDRQV